MIQPGLFMFLSVLLYVIKLDCLLETHADVYMQIYSLSTDEDIIGNVYDTRKYIS